MNIWIDLANSPQVLFFRPIIQKLEAQGHHIHLTSRAYAQTIALADLYGFQHDPIGIHGGKKWRSIIQQNLGRVAGLLKWAKDRPSIDLAVSHNSYSQALAARLLGIRTVTLMDYEHQPLNHLCFRLAQRVIVPDVFPTDLLRRFGAARKTKRYEGIKEQMYLADFIPESNFCRNNDLPEDMPIVAIRPPAPWTAYHRFENTLFDKVVERLLNMENVFLVFLPRVTVQKEWAKQFTGGRFRVPEKALNGPDLLAVAQAVISGGGTMNREAAVLGAPAFSVFRGKSCAVDRFLVDQNRLHFLTSEQQLENLQKEIFGVRMPGFSKPELVDQVVRLILS